MYLLLSCSFFIDMLQDPAFRNSIGDTNSLLKYVHIYVLAFICVRFIYIFISIVCTDIWGLIQRRLL